MTEFVYQAADAHVYNYTHDTQAAQPTELVKGDWGSDRLSGELFLAAMSLPHKRKELHRAPLWTDSDEKPQGFERAMGLVAGGGDRVAERPLPAWWQHCTSRLYMKFKKKSLIYDLCNLYRDNI